MSSIILIRTFEIIIIPFSTINISLQCFSLNLIRFFNFPGITASISGIPEIGGDTEKIYMNITILLAVLAFVAIAWNIVSGILIIRDLQKRQQKINFVFIKLMLPIYAHRYKKITLEETGKVGLLFYHWVIAINGALVFAVAAIISNSLK